MAFPPLFRRMRPSFDSIFLDIAFTMAKRSTCDRAQVGCVLVRDNRILACGYNGSPSGSAHCDEAGHVMLDNHCVRAIHAEQNAIADAAARGVSLRGAHAYVTHGPCTTCAKLLSAAGVLSVTVPLSGVRPDETYSRLVAPNLEWRIVR